MTEANIGHRLAQAASCPPPPDLHIVGEGEVHHFLTRKHRYILIFKIPLMNVCKLKTKI